MINHINPLLVVLERLAFADPAKGAFFFWDEVKDWPSGSLDILVTSGFLQPAQPMLNIECDGCEERCSNKPVVIYPTQEGKLGRAFIVCDELEDMGRIKVSFDRMRQWQSSTHAVCGFVADSLGLRRSGKQSNVGDLHEIGVAAGKKRNQMLCLQVNAPLTLVAGNNGLPLADFIGYANGAYSLDAVMVRQLVDNATTADARNTPSDPAAAFLAMENLDASELSIAFVGDQADVGFGANNMLEVSARKETRRIALAALDLVDRRRGTLNGEGAVLLGLAQKKRLGHSGANAAKMKRLRDVLRGHFGIKGDPFEHFQKGNGWFPRFSITDKRGAADERARREAERRTESFEELSEQGRQFTGTDHGHKSVDDKDDDAADWLKENDPDR